MFVLQDQEWLSVWEKCSYAHRQVDEQPTKRSKNDDKSAVALLKKGDWHERGPVTDQSHDRSGQPDKRSDKKFGRKSSQRRYLDLGIQINPIEQPIKCNSVSCGNMSH